MAKIHIIPVEDLREHAERIDCWCRPRVEVEENGILIVHHALDGREDYEEGRMLQ